MIEVELPDGSIAEFPDGTSPDVIKGALQKRFSAPQTEAAPAQETPSGRHLTYEEGLLEMEKERQSGASGKIGAGLSGYIGDLPIVGPALLGGVERAAAGLSSMIGGGSYDDRLEQAQRTVQAAQEQNPYSRLAGGLAGNIAALGAVGSTAKGARLLGITGRNLGTRAAASAASGGAISGADTAVRGGDASDVINSTAIGAGAGGAIPILGAGIRAGVQAAGERIYPIVNALKAPAAEAERRVGVALTRDAAANPGMMLNQADEAVAGANNIPLVNVDRGGETTRALARSVANQSPEARAIIENTSSDRFGAQSQRAMEFIRRLTGGNADDLAYQETLRKTARATNAPAYKAAFDDPQAQTMFSPRIQQLMQSPSFREAIEAVPSRSADRGAVQGFKEIGNPFSKNSQGAYVLRRDANGQLVAPNLRFWDQVKQNLDSHIGTAKRAGDAPRVSDLMGLKTALVDELDGAVPAYKNARQGAAAFFGADDAVEAGKSFANTPRSIPEAQRAWSKFNATERKAFATGYASELIDRIRASGDRTNVINAVFKNQAARESMEMVFGPQRARQIEAYVRVEDIVDRLRGAMGNSTTARQLMEIGIGGGIGGGVGFSLSGGDYKGAIAGALLTGGGRHLARRADSKVMENVARLLTRDNRGSLQIAVQQASRNPAYMRALEAMSNALAAPVRGAVNTAIQ